VKYADAKLASVNLEFHLLQLHTSTLDDAAELAVVSSRRSSGPSHRPREQAWYEVPTCATTED
jgi:hypothetical protein